MIQAKVRDIRGCERADLQVSRIALIVGANGAGKSSILQAIGCAVAGQALILPELGKKGASGLVRSGAQQGSVTVADDGGKVALSYPKADLMSDGDPPHASVFAVGLAHVLDFDEKMRAKVIGQYLKTEPSRQDLGFALADSGCGEIVVDRVWKLIEERGWDGAHAAAKEEGAKLKGQWENITDARYGSRIAASWEPEGWSIDLQAVTLEKASQRVADARGALERALVNAALSDAEIARLEQAAADADAVGKRYNETFAAVDPAEKAEAAAKAALDALPAVPQGHGLPCPHCKGLVHMRQVKPAEWHIEPFVGLPEKELQQRRTALATAEGRHTSAKTALAAARRALREAEEAHNTACRAQADLAAARSKSGDANGVATARQAVVQAEAVQKMIDRKRRAEDMHYRVLRQIAIVDALADDGVRRTKLLRILEVFNRQLGTLSEQAGWRVVALGDNLGATYGGRPYPLLSVSEQYRVRVLFQVAMAQLDGSVLAIIDAADVLDNPGRNGLFGLLAGLDMPVIVGMTLSKVDQAPDLTTAEMGQTWWVEAGIAAPLSAVRKAAA